MSTAAVRTHVKKPRPIAQPDTRAASAKKSTLNWQTVGVIVLIVSVIIGGWWTLENRFERKLEGEIQQVRQEIQQVRQEINAKIEGVNTRIDDVNTRIDDVNTRIDDVNTKIEGVNTRIDAIYQLLLEQR